MSPNTTPSAPRDRAARLALWPTGALPSTPGALLVPTATGSEVIGPPSGTRDVLVIRKAAGQEMRAECARAQRPAHAGRTVEQEPVSLARRLGQFLTASIGPPRGSTVKVLPRRCSLRTRRAPVTGGIKRS